MDLQNELFVSRKKAKRGKATIASLIVHGGIIALIVFISTQAAQRVVAENKPRLAYLSSSAPPPTAPSTPTPRGIECGVDPEAGRQAGSDPSADLRATARDSERSAEG